MIDISIIIPVYNAEKYLPKCLDSVVDQTIQNKEVICIDDGSVDHSVNIVEQYASRYSWIKHYQQANKGPGMARNLGIAKATGRYVAFLDADDWYLDKTALENLVKAADRNNCKACAGLRQEYDNNTGLQKNNFIFRDLKLAEGEIAILDFQDFQIDYHYQNYVISREMLILHNINFPDLRRYQDPPFLTRALLTMGKFCVCAKEFYCFREMHHAWMAGKYLSDFLNGIRMVMQIGKQHNLKVLQKNTISRLNKDFYPFVLKNMNRQALNLLLDIERLRVVPDRIRVLEQICKSKDDEAIALNEYIWLLENDFDFGKALKNRGIKKIAVYGLGNFSEMLHYVLRETDIEIVAAFDKKNQDGKWHGIDIISLDTKNVSCDAVMITPLFYQDIIRELIKNRSEKLISFRELISESWRDIQFCKLAGLTRTDEKIPAVTVIMPVLNGMPYFEQALSSVQKQTLKNIEILVIDAQSDDGTQNLVKRFMKDDARIRLMESDIRSYGHQCNIGLDEAKGQYIAFCESDDLYEMNMLERLYENARKFSWPEIIKADFDMFIANKNGKFSLRHKCLPRNKYSLYGNVISLEKEPVIFNQSNIWNGIYKKKFIEEYKIHFNESLGAAFQDIGFSDQVYLLARQIVFIDESLYRYRRDNIDASSYSPVRPLYRVNEFSYLMDFLDLYANLKEKWSRLVFSREFSLLANDYGKGIYWNGENKTNDDAMDKLRRRISSFLLGMSYSWQENLMEVPKLSMFLESFDKFRSVVIRQQGAELERQAFFARRVRDSNQESGIIIFGAGELGRCVAGLLIRNGYQGQLCFCDNDREVVDEKEICGLPIYTLDNALRYFPKGQFILSIPQFFPQIRKQLLSIGVEESRMIYAPPVWTHLVMELSWEKLLELNLAEEREGFYERN